MNDFNWQMEGSAGEVEAPAPPSPAGPFLRLAAVLFVLFVVVLVAGTITRYLQKQTTEAATEVTEEVLASFRLIQKAALRDDTELLHSFIGDDDPQWGADLIALAEGETPTAHALLGLMLTGATSGPPEVTLSPDFTAAELTVNRLYTATLDAREQQKIRLGQSFWFRHADDRWLWEPTDAAFWGESTRQAFEHVTLIFPEHDRALATQIGERLDTVVEQICTELAGLDCPPGWRPSIQFGVATNRVETGTSHMVLPAPSLIGQPEDEAGREAVINAYANVVAGSLIRQLVGYECCEQLLFFEAILRKQLGQLGLRDWPPLPADYLAATGQTPATGSISVAWFREELPANGVPPELYILIDYMLFANPGATPAALQRELAVAEEYDYEQWLGAFLPEESLAQTEWLAFLYRQAETAEAPPIPLPEQPLQWLCYGQLISYTPRDDAWSLLRTFPDDLFGRLEQHTLLAEDALLSLPGEGQPIFMREGPPLLVRGEKRLPLTGMPDDTHYEAVAVSPSRSRVALRGYGEGSSSGTHWLLDLARCDNGECQLQPLPGEPTWSPDGSQMLVVRDVVVSAEQPTDIALLRGNGSGRSLKVVDEATIGRFGNNFAGAFWIDNSSYGYLRTQGYGFPEGFDLIINHVRPGGADERAFALSIQRLLEALPEGYGMPSYQPNIDTITPNPADPAQLIVPLYFSTVGRTALYLVNWQTERFRLLHEQDGQSHVYPSPDGRWLALHMTSPRSTEWDLALLDLKSGTLQQIGPSYTIQTGPVWSADGRWLLNRHERHLLLIAPAHDYIHFVPLPDDLRCQMAVWRGGDSG